MMLHTSLEGIAAAFEAILEAERERLAPLLDAMMKRQAVELAPLFEAVQDSAYTQHPGPGAKVNTSNTVKSRRRSSVTQATPKKGPAAPGRAERLKAERKDAAAAVEDLRTQKRVAVLNV
jgi:hypothetical protein